MLGVFLLGCEGNGTRVAHLRINRNATPLPIFDDRQIDPNQRKGFQDVHLVIAAHVDHIREADVLH